MVEVVERPGGTGDPEERAIWELVHDLAPRALEEARRLGSEFELFEADISVELRTWTADASVVAAALAALDEHWRIGVGLVALAGEAEDVGTTLPPSLADLAAPSYYGLIVVAFQPGSSRVWLKMQKIGRAAL